MRVLDSSDKLSRLFDILPFLVDEKVGILEYVLESPKEPGAPDYFHFSAEACNTSAFSPRQNFRSTGGASADRSNAMAKAVGEAIERYCSALYEMGELPLISFDAAPFQCVPPSEFALYTSEQYSKAEFPFVPFHSTTPVRWTPTYDAETRDSWHVPAAMVYMPYAYARTAGEAPIAQPVSTGLACHCSPSEAAVSAVCEVIERDGFTITWQAMLPVPEIRLPTLCEQNRNLVDRFERANGSVRLFDITLDHGVPTVLSVLRGEEDGPALVFAASAALNPDDAVRKSLEELAHTHNYARYLMSLPRLDTGNNYDAVVNQDGHVQMYCYQEKTTLADFLDREHEFIDLNEITNLSTGNPENDLKILVQRVKSVGHQVLLVDLTTPEIRDLGVTVMRAVIPGFHPLCFGHRLRALGGRRLWEVPQKLGFKGITYEEGDNPAPHPFP